MNGIEEKTALKAQLANYAKLSGMIFIGEICLTGAFIRAGVTFDPISNVLITIGLIVYILGVTNFFDRPSS